MMDQVTSAILGIIGIVFLNGLVAMSKADFVTTEQQRAKSLAETQMEDVKSQDHAVSYNASPIPDEYTGYSVTIDAETVDWSEGFVQKITVMIEHDDEEVIRLEGYKVD